MGKKTDDSAANSTMATMAINDRTMVAMVAMVKYAANGASLPPSSAHYCLPFALHAD